MADGTVKVTLTQFDSQDPFEVVRDNMPITDFKALTLNQYSPRGGTPLRDAMGEFIGHLDKAQKKNKTGVTIGLLLDRSGSMNPLRKAVVDGINEFVGGMRDTEVDDDARGKVLAVIFTDGLENASTEVSAEALRSMTDEREKRGDWTFIYLGANQDAWAAGYSVGLRGAQGSGQSVNYAATPVGTSSAFRRAGKQSEIFLSSNALYAAATSSMGDTVDENDTETAQELIDKLKGTEDK